MKNKTLSAKNKQKIERTVANDRSYKAILYNRFFIFLVLVLIQCTVYVWTWYLFIYNTNVGVIFQIVLRILSLVSVLYIINKMESASRKLNWILILLIAPVFGVPFYFLYGEERPTRRMRKKLDESEKAAKAAVAEKYGATETELPQTRADGASYFLQKFADYPSFHNGDVRYYPSGEEVFPDMLTALRSAKSYVLIEYFIINHGRMWKEILQILLEKAEQGVQIRILYDDFGCMMTLPPKYEKYLEGLHPNIRCMTFNNVVPVFAVRMNNRDHRKMLVVDGKIAFTGGVNIADEYINEKRRFGYWKDSALKITGDGVRSFVQIFFGTWNAFAKQKEEVSAYLPPAENPERGGQVCVQPYASSPFDKISVASAVYMDAICRAQKSLYIFTPYLILDDGLRAALCQAALRGVDVRIVTPGTPDKKLTFRMTRANYAILMRAGVKIYEYTPGFLHAKSMLCDGESAIVGSVNLDYRSLYLHFENGVCFSGCQAVADLQRDCENTFAASKLCTPESVKRGVFGRLIDSVLRVFETLF